MAIDPQAVVKFLKESRIRLYEEEDDDKDEKGLKEGDKVKVKVDDESHAGTISKIDGDDVTVKAEDSNDTWTVKKSEVTKAE